MIEEAPRKNSLLASGVPAAIALVTLVIHLATHRGYGYFRDEFYYMACGRHLDWGYVDHPPLIAAIAALSRVTLGESLLAIRLAPAIGHAALVFLSGVMARMLGGNRFAQALAALSVLVAPVYLVNGAILTMNVFDHLLWSVCVVLTIVLLQRSDPRVWLWIGLVAGIGLMNKHSIAFFLVALVAGLLLTPERRLLRGRWPWIGAGIAALIFLPNLIWQIQHHFPTLEFLRNAAEQKNYSGSVPEFLAAQVMLVHPLALSLWSAGLGYLLAASAAARFRALGWNYLIVLVLLIVSRGKHYYLAPAYPMLLAAGAVAVTRWLERRRLQWLELAYASALLAGGVVAAPLFLPVLPPEKFIHYSEALLYKEPQSERHRRAKLPQYFADMFGWEEMVAEVARVYQSLPPEERARCAIFASNYGEAGAIDFFGKKYGLPPAVSGHNSYFLWGPPRPDADVVITVGESFEDVSESFHDVRVSATFRSEYNMPYESDLPILIGRKPRMSWREIWPNTKKYI